jgi:dTDP-4-dehydrorhamnose 3,5-epimerase
VTAPVPSEQVDHATIAAGAARAIEFYWGDIEGVQIFPLLMHQDERGWLTELFRSDDLAPELVPMMAYLSQTEPGVARGPHEHVQQTDFFAFLGPSDFELYLWDARPGSPTHRARLRKVFGVSNPCTVVVPPGVVHGYRNIGSIPGWVINAPNRLYRGPGKTEPVDEIRHEAQGDSPYKI